MDDPPLPSPSTSPQSPKEGEKDYSRSLKVLVVGDTGVGKTNLISRLIHGTFDLESKSTVGLSNLPKIVQLGDTTVKVRLWDTGRPEKDSTNDTEFSFTSATCLLIVYDVTKSASFRNIESKWMKYLQSYFNFQTGVVMLVGNKSDLLHLRDVKTDVGKKFAQKNGFLFTETSALDNSNVTEALHKLLTELVKRIGESENLLNESVDGMMPNTPEITLDTATTLTVPATSSCVCQ